jgi:hypothetical protein
VKKVYNFSWHYFIIWYTFSHREVRLDLVGAFSFLGHLPGPTLNSYERLVRTPFLAGFMSGGDLSVHGLESRAIIFAPSSRRGVFSLDSPLYRTRLPDI